MSVVIKIGGKSQDSIEKVEQFAEEAVRKFGRKEPLVLIVSAIGNATNDLETAMKNGSLDISPLIQCHDPYFSHFGGDEVIYRGIQDDFSTFYRTYKRNRLAQLKPGVLVSPERLASFLMGNAMKKIRGREVAWIDFYDRRFPLVATSGERNYLSSSVDIGKSRARAEEAANLLKEYDLILPGFGGVTLENAGGIKTFGRGGSDEAALGCGYLFGADEVWICTDQDGIKAAFLEEPYKKETETLTRLDIEEAKACAFLGAKLPSEQALLPLERAYEEGMLPRVYIAHAQNLNGNTTQIVPSETNSQSPAKFVGGRDITQYYIVNGNPLDLLELERDLIEAGTDYRIFGKSGSRGEIGVFGKGSDIADEIVQAHERKLSVKRYGDRAIVGIVGSGMLYVKGLTERMYHTLTQNGINVFSSSDYSDVSTVSVISAANRSTAVATLYEALPFIRNGQ